MAPTEHGGGSSPARASPRPSSNGFCACAAPLDTNRRRRTVKEVKPMRDEKTVQAHAERLGLRLVKSVCGPYYMLEHRREPDPDGWGGDLVVFGALGSGYENDVTPN